MSDFVHLHLHTEWSLLDGAIRLKDLFPKAQEYGYQAVAITDHGNLFGLIHFYEKAKEFGIKPILGCELYVAPGSRFERKAKSAHEAGYHLVVLCQNETGYRNLLKLITLANFEGFYWKPRVDKELLRKYSEGLIALSACLHGEVASAALRGNMDEARRLAKEYAAIFPGRFYLELQENDMPEQKQVNEALAELAKELGLPLVATNDCHYLKEEDARVHDVLLCIQTNKLVTDENRMRFSTDKLYFASPEEMKERFSWCPEAIENTLRIAEECHLELELGKHHFPRYPLPQGRTYEEVFEEKARAGFEDRLAKLKEWPGLAASEKEYRERLELELEIIKEKGFASYFLVVADFIAWAKKKGIPVGPGRGSAAGSLVAYAMGITELDPIRYGLLFERFLNAERASLPDIDVDFCMRRREEVIRYVRERYGGEEFVAQIATFGQMKAKAVVRDVGRALGMPYPQVDKIAKLIPETVGITLEQAIAAEPRLKELIEKDPKVRELMAIAQALEGLPRHSSTHAAGVVIADAPLTNYCPLMKGDENEIVTQFDMKAVEKVGLIKFDFLGLKTLTIIDHALRLAKEHYGAEIDLSRLPLDDEKTYELLRRGETDGVFQLESAGMKELLVRMRPSEFNDLIAILALYRPGPLESGMVDQYVKAKHGEIEVEYPLPQLEPILKETYGVIVYQEQVMKIAQVLAGYSLGEADILRRAMGKKKPEVMAAQKERFIKGATERGIPKDKAEYIFDLMEKFAGYGFNKSHSAAYALVAYQTAYLKAHYPICYMTALLSYEMGNTDQIVKYVSVCKHMGIEVLPPDINESEVGFSIKDEKVRFGLGAVKNVGEGAIEEIIKARQEGPFKSFEDFCLRVDLKKVNRRVMEALIKAGAFDSLGYSRAALFDVLPEMIDWAQARKRAKEQGQKSIFDFASTNGEKDNTQTFEIPNKEEWPINVKLKYEREALGFYFSGHPLEPYREWLSLLTPYTVSSLIKLKSPTKVGVGGAISEAKVKNTRRGDRMAILKIEDGYETIEVIVFPDLLRDCEELIEEKGLVFVLGRFEKDDRGAKIVAEKLVPLNKAQEVVSGRMALVLNGEETDISQLKAIYDILKETQGRLPVDIKLKFSEGEVLVDLNGSFKLDPRPELARTLKDILGYVPLKLQISFN
ncbi:DNA polymerase III, alpha subunit [Thermodesulfatator indicus DSM 15286]|uniref:DNA polymerase III subunit alpha n=1 Tax=Thermodesulfatator indicus (strain DSM 15286 / JCM 11887 / CIR29812) TaxID=667014 RepID=F8AD16_THEID|nr:DNA polymerase III subunit alpha [Thermodesulfatator indicus]AEH45882.1 DNA polymerase III, alpha subunit [Thermodesulfatator indicus DSM 15286]